MARGIIGTVSWLAAGFLLLASVVPAEMDFGRPAGPHPARGWDSYDAFDLKGLNEARVLEQAAVFATIPEGEFRYLVLDEGWAETIGPNNEKQGWFLDEYCRPYPNPATFPGSNGTRSLAYLARQLRAMNLSLGVWHMKGIPEQALRTDCKIKGSDGRYSAKDVGIPQRRCVWHEDVLGVSMENPAARLYFESIAEMFKEWGVEYVKIDCVFGERDWDVDSMVGFSNALATVFPPGRMVYSVSPGVRANPQRTLSVTDYVSSYRITDDLWDQWGPDEPQAPSGINVQSVTRALVDFRELQMRSGFGGGFAYADADMLPIGVIRLGGEHLSRIQPAEARYLYGLWSITLSPIILGGDMSSMANLPWMRDLLVNRLAVEVSTHGAHPRVVTYRDAQPGTPGVSIWCSRHKTDPYVRYVGIFRYVTGKQQESQTGAVESFRLSLEQLELPPGVVSAEIEDVFAEKKEGAAKPPASLVVLGSLTFGECRLNDACLFKLRFDKPPDFDLIPAPQLTVAPVVVTLPRETPPPTPPQTFSYQRFGGGRVVSDSSSYDQVLIVAAVAIATALAGALCAVVVVLLRRRRVKPAGAAD